MPDTLAIMAAVRQEIAASPWSFRRGNQPASAVYVVEREPLGSGTLLTMYGEAGPPRSAYKVALLEGEVFLLGGFNGTDLSRIAARLSPCKTGEWPKRAASLASLLADTPADSLVQVYDGSDAALRSRGAYSLFVRTTGWPEANWANVHKAVELPEGRLVSVLTFGVFQQDITPYLTTFLLDPQCRILGWAHQKLAPFGLYTPLRSLDGSPP